MLENSDDRIILATGGYDHTIKIWQTHTGICQRTLQHTESQINALEITANLQLLAAASYQHIRMFDLTSNTPNALVNYDGVPKNVTSIGFQENDKWMYSGGEDGKARIWDLRANNMPCIKSFEVNGGAPITCVKLHPNQVEMFIGDQSGAVTRWDLKTGNFEQYIPDGTNMILDIAIDPFGSYMTAINSKGRCYIWEIIAGANLEPTKLAPKNKIDAHTRQGLCCKFSPDASLLVTTSADQNAKIWDTSTFEPIQELNQENQRWVWDAAFSGDSQYVFTASSDGTAKLWNVKTGKMEREYTGHQKAITSLAFRDVIIRVGTLKSLQVTLHEFLKTNDLSNF